MSSMFHGHGSNQWQTCDRPARKNGGHLAFWNHFQRSRCVQSFVVTIALKWHPLNCQKTLFSTSKLHFFFLSTAVVPTQPMMNTIHTGTVLALFGFAVRTAQQYCKNRYLPSTKHLRRRADLLSPFSDMIVGITQGRCSGNYKRTKRAIVFTFEHAYFAGFLRCLRTTWNLHEYMKKGKYDKFKKTPKKKQPTYWSFKRRALTGQKFEFRSSSAYWFQDSGLFLESC